MAFLRERGRALLREPMIHFVAIGGALFALHAAVAKPPRGSIVVEAAFVEGLREEQRERTGVLPGEAETRGLVERYVDEEVLYREALALGLDRGDLIVRRRLVQKMELLARAQVREPDDAELAAHLAANPDRYRSADRVSLTHVFVSRDRHGDGARAIATGLLDSLRAGGEPDKLGDPFVAGASFARRSRADLTATFGAAFAGAVLSLPPGEWSGPVESTYGFHLVRVSARDGGRAPELAEVRARVREDLLSDRRESAVREEIGRLRGKYAIAIEGKPLWATRPDHRSASSRASRSRRCALSRPPRMPTSFALPHWTSPPSAAAGMTWPGIPRRVQIVYKLYSRRAARAPGMPARPSVSSWTAVLPGSAGSPSPPVASLLCATKCSCGCTSSPALAPPPS
ncbi:MAG: peptidylprolyl isomerase [Polyangiaceae bacterium]